MNIFVAASAVLLGPAEAVSAQTLAIIPAATRRRLSGYAKMIMAVIFEVLDQYPSSRGVPVVLASRHGDLHRTIDLLKQLVANEPLSPTQFCLSVNNAVLGQLSVITNNQQGMTTISAGEDSFAAAWLEGYLQLQDNPAVLVVYADEHPPEPYSLQCDSPAQGIAFAALLTLENNINFRSVTLQRKSKHGAAAHSERSNTILVARALHEALQGSSTHVRMKTELNDWSWHVQS
ncbi:beta-ketoacyl synthase chain length factor [Pseudidiomarina salinarum]|uniref:beta-ketoacyl synthase chain length factor n=1 Tax=Pseudidiomarina salinarum TaxID=435908 RepID=UPI00068E0DD7|nr:beta-ketoacyl synthase chain length factor [Pseudidiomarina salinarum]RUO71337.1 beta-ketoacyl synthase [Pseudidiomarina salinarum]